MATALESSRRRWRGRSPHLVPLACIAAAVLAANLPALLHLVTVNPLVIDAHLTPGTTGVLPGLPSIDPDSGYTSQALGRLAAMDWLHGHVPWWNPFEGIGSPLAGEMQSGAFFPLTLLLALHEGLLILQIVLELVTGWATYFLVRRLGVGRSFSVAAGVAFGLCGTYAWFSFAPNRPIALIPLALLGVERSLSAAAEHRRGGWQLLAVAIALSILAGFPETTFIDGLLVMLWALMRMVGTGRACWLPLLAKVTLGGVVGIALAAPLAVAFVTYLPAAYIGLHSGGLARISLPSRGLPQVLLPYSLGPIFAFHTASGPVDVFKSTWGNVGGFLSVTLAAAGLVGLVGRRNRTLRLGLGTWILLCLLRTYGFPPVVHLMAVTPGLRLTAFYRYSDPSWEFAAVVLAALGLDDIARHLTRRRVLVAAVSITAALSVWATAAAWPILTGATGATVVQGAHRHAYAIFSLAAAVIFLTILLAGATWAGGSGRGARRERSRRRGRLVMAAGICFESVLLLGFPYLSAPKPTRLETGSVAWLQAHLGTYRFYTLGPIQPNYGSYFGINELDVNDLPSPATFNNYIQAHLDTNALLFTGGSRRKANGPSPATELTEHLANYEAMGTRYVVEKATGTDAAGNPWPPAGTRPWPVGPRLVHRGRLAEIWELPHPSLLFAITAGRSATSGSSGRSARSAHARVAACTVSVHGADSAEVTCAHPSVLVRREQFLPGWSATINGRTVSVRKATTGPAGLFEQVDLPAGTSQVHFTFLPPYELPAFIAAASALILLVGSIFLRATNRKRLGAPGSDLVGTTGPMSESPGPDGVGRWWPNAALHPRALSVTTAISVPENIHKRATQRAQDLGMSRSEFFSRAAARYLDELDRESSARQVDPGADGGGTDGGG